MFVHVASTRKLQPKFLAFSFLNTKLSIYSIQYQAVLAEAVTESLKEKLCQELSFESLKLSDSLV